MITVKRTRRLSASYGTRLASFVIGERIPLIIKMTFFFRLDTSYNLSHVGRLPEYPQDDGANVDVSFYLTNPSTSAPVLQRVLASMLLVQISDLRNTLTQDVALRTSAAPGAPPAASSQQIENSVVIRISSFTANRVSASYPYSLPLRYSGHCADIFSRYSTRKNPTPCIKTAKRRSIICQQVNTFKPWAIKQNGARNTSL